MLTGNRKTGSPPLAVQIADDLQRDDQAAAKTKNTIGAKEDSITTPIQKTVGSNEAVKIQPQIQNQEQSAYNSRDIIAQESMADASVLMALAAIGTLFVTAVGTCFLAWQVILTRKAVEETTDATVAMREANQIARDSSERQLRAYLSAEEHFVSGFFHGGHATFQLKIWNRGQTPARQVRAWCVVTGTKGNPDELRIIRPNKFAQSNTTIAPGEWLLLSNDCQGPLSHAAYLAVASGGVAMVFAGVISYRDVFGKLHRTTFKQFYRGCGNWAENESDLTACGNGNTSN